MIDAITFAHQGPGDYLEFVLKTAIKSNSGKRVVVIGDDANRHLAGAAEFHHLSDYKTDIERLRGCYDHQSSNGYEGEMFAIARWIITANFCQENNFQRVFHADSDTLVFSNLDKIDDAISNFEVATSDRGSSHSTFWNGDTLSEFRDFIFTAYEDRAGEIGSELRAIGADLAAAQFLGGISDMWLVETFCRTRKWINVTSQIAGGTFDHNINSAENGESTFRMFRGLKQITWINGRPYGTVDDTGEMIKFHSLHHQGGAKRWIERFSNGLPPMSKPHRAFNKVLRRANALLQTS